MMNPEVQKQTTGPGLKKIAGIALTAFIVLTVASSTYFTYMTLNNDRIYNGVYINGMDVGNMTAGELTKLLNKNYRDRAQNVSLTLKCGKSTQKVVFPAINVKYDVRSAVEKAYEIGRYRSIPARLYDIFQTGRKGKRLELSYSYDRKKMEQIVEMLFKDVFVNVKEADIYIGEERVTIRSGHNGRSFNKDAVYRKIDRYIKNCKGGTISISVVKTPPHDINVEEYYKQITREAADAYAKVENNNVVVVPHITGRSIDKSALAAIASELDRVEDTEKELPVIFTKPRITAEDVYRNLFKDTLYTAETQFTTSTQNDSNRGNNIRIAVSHINGIIIPSGGIFSFNDTVGPRTEAGGYKAAHVYAEGTVVNGIGGGICQVSTTLYNAVLFSDLEVVERTNHMFKVGYVPLGRDAAVSYGQVDFKFKNSTRWPIKINGYVTKDNRIIFSITGTNESPGKTVEISYNIIRTDKFATRYIDDPSMGVGKTEVKTPGMTGCVVDSYKIVKMNNEVVSSSKLHTSIYRPLTQEIRRGTKKNVPVPSQPKQIKGVDDADNPPADNSPAANDSQPEKSNPAENDSQPAGDNNPAGDNQPAV